MTPEDAHQQIRAALRAELKRRHGQIGQIEADLSRSEGYLSRFCRGDMELTLKGALEVLEALDIEPGSFFSSAFGTVTRSEDVLKMLEGPGPFDRHIGSLQETADQVRLSADVPEASSRRHRASVDDLKSLPVDIQLRRLRTGRKYQSERFADEFLVWLERYRYDDPKSASRLVVGLATHVVPEIPATRVTRIGWFCRCIEVYASCLRATNGSRSAARALRFALGLSRSHGLSVHTSALLRRAAFVASDFAEYERGLFLLREAQEIALEDGDERNLGYIAISRAMLFNYSGNPLRAVKSYRCGIGRLAGLEDDEARRWLLGAYSGLANVYTNLDQLDDARKWLTRATSTFQNEGGLILGKLLWQQGSLERSMGHLQAAERSLRGARKLLESGSGMEMALVSIELASVLLELREHREALEVAKSLVALTGLLDGNPLAESALLEFMRIVLAGGLDLAVLQDLRSSIEKGRPLRRGVQPTANE